MPDDLGQSVASRRRRFWVCADCGIPAMRGIWDGYADALIDPFARTIRMGEENVRHEVHQPDSPPEKGSMQCSACGCPEAEHRLMTDDEIGEALLDAEEARCRVR